MKKLIVVFLVATFCYTGAQAQSLRTPAASPSASVKQDFALSSIEISYSRPAVKGRTIFGNLVPYGKVWRTGANSATTVTFGEDVTVGGKPVKAGKYGLLTIPGEKEWKVIISKQTDVTSPAAYKQDQDVAQITVTPASLTNTVENFTIQVGNITSNTCELWIQWDKTSVAVPIVADVESQVMKQIDRMVINDNRPYFTAAMYYLENNKDLNKALDWFNKAAQSDPKAFWVVHQKANCLAKLGRKSEAIEAAKLSISLAQEAKNDDYVKLNQDLIEKLK